MGLFRGRMSIRPYRGKRNIMYRCIDIHPVLILLIIIFSKTWKNIILWGIIYLGIISVRDMIKKYSKKAKVIFDATDNINMSKEAQTKIKKGKDAE